MIIRILLLGSLLSAVSAEDVILPLHMRERVAPWGTVVERESYYLKDGEVVEHGVQESFSPDGVIWRRGRYAHGKPDGPYVFFYDGIGSKQTETPYAEGVEDGLSRTWDPDGKLLFEGTWKNGEKWDGWFDKESSSSSGGYHDHGQSWKIDQWKHGKKAPGTTRVVKSGWRTWAPGRLPDQKMFIRWSWPQFETKSAYPYLNRMPAYTDVPYLIECFEKKGEGYQEASDQLTALTRMQFGNPWLLKDGERIAAVSKWREWWESVGKQRPKARAERGMRDVEAWDLARRGRNLPLPEEALVIPESYELIVHFGSGDYGGVTSETLTIRRNADAAELVRSYSVLRDGPVTEERWLPFGVKDADRLTRALGYLIDRPWLLNDEAEIETRYWAGEKADPKRESSGLGCEGLLKGRESYGPPYYPNVDFELRDGGGRLWWNANPDRWYGANPERFNATQRSVPGAVFPFLAARYPELERWGKTGKPGWVANRESIDE